MGAPKDVVKDGTKKPITSNGKERYRELLRAAKQHGPVMKTASLIGLAALLGVETIALVETIRLTTAALSKAVDAIKDNSKRLRGMKRENDGNQ